MRIRTVNYCRLLPRVTITQNGGFSSGDFLSITFRLRLAKKERYLSTICIESYPIHSRGRKVVEERDRDRAVGMCTCKGVPYF